MAENGIQVKNGKAFEFALASEFANHFRNFGAIHIIEDQEFTICKRDFDSQTPAAQHAFIQASRLPIDTLQRIEPGLSHPRDQDDKLYVRFLPDSAGRKGDVRDVVFYRKKNDRMIWEIGLSAKNNHEAVKHPRISPSIDFGRDWALGTNCSDSYMKAVREVFDWVKSEKELGKSNWKDLGPLKIDKVYRPLKDAFKEELARLGVLENMPSRLIHYLIGVKPFYKVIKHDRYNVVTVKAFNFITGLNLTYNGVKPEYKPEIIPMPTRVVDISDKDGSQDTVTMIMDKGWQVDFRFHNAETKLANSVKLDVQLKGNPPVLFTQYLF